MELNNGIEPSSSAWKAEVLPLNEFSNNNGAQSRTRTGMISRPTDFKSVAYTYFATWAYIILYDIIFIFLVGVGRIELSTSDLSGLRSNQLSYTPMAEEEGFEPSR